MGIAISLRTDYSAGDLRRLAKASKDADQSRRLLALAEIYAGGSRTRAAKLGAVELQSVRDWVLRFNAGGPAGLIDPKAPGPQPKLNDDQRQALAVLVEAGPIPAIHGVVRWRRADLVQWIFQEYGLSLEVSSVGRELRALGFVKLSPRPRHHGQNEFAVEAFKKTSPPIWQRSGQNCPPARR
jgi:transposase